MIAKIITSLQRRRAGACMKTILTGITSGFLLIACNAANDQETGSIVAIEPDRQAAAIASAMFEQAVSLTA